MAGKIQRLLRACRVDQSAHGRDPIRGNAYAFGMFSDGRLVRGEINAVHLVAGYVAMKPLDRGAHILQNADRLLREFPQLGFGQIPGSRDFAFDDKLRHGPPLMCTNASMQVERLQDGSPKAVTDQRKMSENKQDEVAMDIRSLQKPLKDQYRNDPDGSHITLRAKGGQTDVPVACSVDLGRAIYQAEAHKGVGGAGAGACSGDLLLGALAACAQITCQMVAAAMGIPTERIEVTVEGDLDLRGTLGISKDVPVGFESIHLRFDVAAPKATPEQLRGLREKTEQYCVVMQTLMRPPSLESEWAGHD